MKKISNARTLKGGRDDEILVGGNCSANEDWALTGYGPQKKISKKASKKTSKKSSKKFSLKGGSMDAFELSGGAKKKASKKASKKKSTKKKSTKKRSMKRIGKGSNARVLTGSKKKASKKKSTKKKSTKKRSVKRIGKGCARVLTGGKKKSTKKKSVKFGRGNEKILIGGKKKASKKTSMKKTSKKSSSKSLKLKGKKGGNFWDWIKNTAEDIGHAVENNIVPISSALIRGFVGGATDAQLKRAQTDFTKSKRRADIRLRDAVDYEKMALIEEHDINRRDKASMSNLSKYIAQRKKIYSDDLKLRLLQAQAEVYESFANSYNFQG
jgi:hypothetical protein